MAFGKDYFPKKEAKLPDGAENFTAQVATGVETKGILRAEATDVQQKKAHFLICTGSVRAQTGRGRRTRKKTPQKTR
jgi:hypothetical protein